MKLTVGMQVLVCVTFKSNYAEKRKIRALPQFTHLFAICTKKSKSNLKLVQFSSIMVAEPFGYLDLVYDFKPNNHILNQFGNDGRRQNSQLPIYLWFANVVNFTLPICLNLLSYEPNSTFTLSYVSTNYGNILPNSSFTNEDILHGINFSGVPGNVYDFKLVDSFGSNVWNYAMITEPDVPDYVEVKIDPDGLQGMHIFVNWKNGNLC